MLSLTLAYPPVQVGDFGILVRSGFSVTKALFFNFLSALVALAGTAMVRVLCRLRPISFYVKWLKKWLIYCSLCRLFSWDKILGIHLWLRYCVTAFCWEYIWLSSSWSVMISNEYIIYLAGIYSRWIYIHCCRWSACRDE